MNFDYSPAELAPRRSARRSVVMATLCVVMLSAVVSHESIATRSNALTGSVPSAVAEAFPDSVDVLATESAIQTAVADAAPPPADTDWKAITIQPGQTLSTLFESEGLPYSESVALLSLSKDAAKLRNLRVGDVINLRKNAEQQLEELSFELDITRTLHIRRVEDKLERWPSSNPTTKGFRPFQG